MSLKKTPDHHTFDKAHGRIEHRSIWVSSELKGYLNFPYADQVFLVERHTEYLRSGKKRTEIAYGISSLSAEQADAKRLLELNRGHWEIENRLHYVRDVSFDEDRSQIHHPVGARLMASIRNLVISIFRLLGFRYVPDAIRYFARRPEQTYQLLGI